MKAKILLALPLVFTSITLFGCNKNAIKSITATQDTSKEYKRGGFIFKDDITVTATLNDGTSKTLSKDEWSSDRFGDNNSYKFTSSGVNKIDIKYQDKSCDLKLNVSPKANMNYTFNVEGEALNICVNEDFYVEIVMEDEDLKEDVGLIEWTLNDDSFDPSVSIEPEVDNNFRCKVHGIKVHNDTNPSIDVKLYDNNGIEYKNTLDVKVSDAKGVEVELAEWNSAIEGIVHVKEDKELNYIATGDVAFTTTNNYIKHLTYLEANGKCSKSKTFRSTASSIKFNNYSYRDGLFYLLMYQNVQEGYDYSVNQFGLEDVFNAILDAYNNINYFEFKDNKYKTLPDASRNYYLEIEFRKNGEDKQIYSIYFDYNVVDSPLSQYVTKIKGQLNFKYGNATVSEKDFPSTWELNMKNKILNLNYENYFEASALVSYDNLIKIDLAKGTSCVMVTFGSFAGFIDDDSCIKVYKDGKLLTRAKSEEEEGDYYLADPSTTASNYYSSLMFKKPFDSEDKQVQIYTYHGQSQSNVTVYFTNS